MNKIFARRRFNAREVAQLIVDGWNVAGDRTYAHKNGVKAVPVGNMFKPRKLLTKSSEQSYMFEGETRSQTSLRP